jgi:peptide-methionine (S)-S-oxide reductase
MNDEQKKIAFDSKDKTQKLWDDPIVTEIEPLTEFHEAEEEHQNFFKKHPELGYCQVVINPKLEKLRKKFAAKLK